MRKTIPIAILHRNEFINLKLMIDSIEKNTNYPYMIFIVDNNSSCRDEENILSSLEQNKHIKVIRSKHNNWALGFNKAINHPDWPTSSKYYIFSDADIVVPETNLGGKCWLSFMVEEISKYDCIGKLGISLRVSDIDNDEIKNDVLKRNKKFNSGQKIGPHFIAPVDTTLAIYRNDLFVTSKFKFSIGHASLIKPYYYTCITPQLLEAQHLGWYKNFKINIDDIRLKEKIRCFAKYSGYIEKETLLKCNKFDRLYYKLIHPLATSYWGSIVMLKIAYYCIRNFPRKINKIQFDNR